MEEIHIAGTGIWYPEDVITNDEIVSLSVIDKDNTKKNGKISKDEKSEIKAKEKFDLIVKDYPNTDFALDSQFKLDLIEDILASKEMYLGRYYLKKGKWIASTNRFKNVINDYDKTIFIEEALHRLVEIYYLIGIL